MYNEDNNNQRTFKIYTPRVLRYWQIYCKNTLRHIGYSTITEDVTRWYGYSSKDDTIQSAQRMQQYFITCYWRKVNKSVLLFSTKLIFCNTREQMTLRIRTFLLTDGPFRYQFPSSEKFLILSGLVLPLAQSVGHRRDVSEILRRVNKSVLYWAKFLQLSLLSQDTVARIDAMYMAAHSSTCRIMGAHVYCSSACTWSAAPHWILSWQLATSSSAT